MRRSSLTVSAVFHGMVFILASMGLPLWAKHEFIIPPPIVVDFIEISKVTETNKVAPQPVLKPEEKPTPAPAAKNTAAEAVVPVSVQKPKIEEKKETKKESKSFETDPNQLPDKNKTAKKEEAKKEPQKDFASVLKNLVDPKNSGATKTPEAKAGSAAPGQNAPFGPKLTMSEEDALRSQLEKCWNVPYGAKDVESMNVDIFMVINPDRTLREARIVNQALYNSNTFFRAAADSALRAVKSPLCSPFNLPPDKYDTWNTITVTFNPKDMF